MCYMPVKGAGLGGKGLGDTGRGMGKLVGLGLEHCMPDTTLL